MKKRKFISLVFALVTVMSMCACKKEPKIVVCGPTTYTFYADNAEAAERLIGAQGRQFSRMSDLPQKIKRQRAENSFSKSISLKWITVIITIRFV